MDARADHLAPLPAPAGRRALGRSGKSRPEPLGGGPRGEPGRDVARGGGVDGERHDWRLDDAVLEPFAGSGTEQELISPRRGTTTAPVSKDSVPL